MVVLLWTLMEIDWVVIKLVRYEDLSRSETSKRFNNIVDFKI